MGKSTVAAALALSLAEQGERTAVISVDPAHSLGDVLDAPLSGRPAAVPGASGLYAAELDAAGERARLMEEWRTPLRQIVDRGTYLSSHEVEELLGLAVPGLDEAAAMLRLLTLDRELQHLRRVVVDTAPTGHTLRLLRLPAAAGGWLRPLHAMHEKHRQVAEQLSGRLLDDEESHFLEELEADRQRLAELLTDAGRLRFVMVTTPEAMVQAETERYRRALRAEGVPLGGVIVNRAEPGASSPQSSGEPVAFAPVLADDPVGLQALRRFASAAAPHPPPTQPPASGGETPPGERYLPPAGRRLYLVAGKGGVGKSTTAGALAAWLASEGPGALLLGIDPAGSLGDLFGVEVSAEPVAAAGLPRLQLRELEPGKAWKRFRERYRDQIDSLFEGVLGPGLAAESDRRVMAELVELAPPGLDEIMALVEVLELLQNENRAVVLDTPPTGHLLSFLETPGVALEWCHALLRVLLRYREATGLGEPAQEILGAARRLGGLRELLADPERVAVLVVALPERLSVPETRRLLVRLRELRYRPDALIVNRLRAADEGPIMQELKGLQGVDARVVAPDMGERPRGVEALLELATSWRRME